MTGNPIGTWRGRRSRDRDDYRAAGTGGRDLVEAVE